MSKTYKTDSGIYDEKDLSVVVWVNSRHEDSPQTRSLETMVSDKSPFPIAFPTRKLSGHPAWVKCPIAQSKQDVDKWLLVKNSNEFATKNKPVLVPLPLAIEFLGWDSFYVPSIYKEI
jgi:hypothetical protein